MIFSIGENNPGHRRFSSLAGSQESGRGSLTSLQPQGHRGPKFKTDQRPEMGCSQLPGEMSEGLNANRLKNVSTRFDTIKVFPPAVTDPSVLDALIMTSQPSGARRVT